MPDDSEPVTTPVTGLEFVAFVNDKIDEYGLLGLARETDVSTGAIRNIIGREGQPKLPTLMKFSTRFKVPLWRLVEMCGYELGLPPSNDVLVRKVTSLVDAMPDLRPILEHLLRLKPEDLNSIVLLLEVQQRQRQAV